MSGGGNWLPKFMPISFFSRVSRFSGVSGVSGVSGRLSLQSGLVPSWPQIMQIRILFRSRSDLVLDADNALDCSSNLVFKACISLCSVSDKSGHLCFCLVLIKMTMLT